MDIKNTDYTQAEGKKNGELEANIRKDREIGQIQRDNFRKAHLAGVRMVFGSDAGVMPHSMVPQQFRTMVEYGMTPLEAIRAATTNAAEALGRTDLGSIAAGRAGDIIAVQGRSAERRHRARACRGRHPGREAGQRPGSAAGAMSGSRPN